MNALINKLILVAASSTDIIGTPGDVDGYVKPGNAAATIANFFSIVFTFCTIVATFFFIKGGIDYIMSGGDASKVKTGQSTIQYAIMGLIVSFLGFAILGIVKSALGISNTDLGV